MTSSGCGISSDPMALVILASRSGPDDVQQLGRHKPWRLLTILQADIESRLHDCGDAPPESCVFHL